MGRKMYVRGFKSRRNQDCISRRNEKRSCFSVLCRDEIQYMQCARRKVEEKDMPCDGREGGWVGVCGWLLSSFCACSSAIGGKARAEPWERHVPELQMVWHCCQGYNWPSIY